MNSILLRKLGITRITGILAGISVCANCANPQAAVAACSVYVQTHWIIDVKKRKATSITMHKPQRHTLCAPLPETGFENAIVEVFGPQGNRIFKRAITLDLLKDRHGAQTAEKTFLASVLPAQDRPYRIVFSDKGSGKLIAEGNAKP